MPNWTHEEIRNLILAVIGAVFVGLGNLLTSLKNQKKINQVQQTASHAKAAIEEHEANAQERARVLKERG